MNKRAGLLAIGATILVSSVTIGVIYDRGLGPDDVPFDTDGPTPAPLPQPNITVSAAYNESTETVRIQIESGLMTAKAYDILRITDHPGPEYGVDDARLKRPGQTELHPSGKWVDTESGGLTSFPVKPGDSVIVVTVDQQDDDGDGIEGIDGEDSLELTYGHRQGVQRQATLASWNVVNGTLVRGGS